MQGAKRLYASGLRSGRARTDHHSLASGYVQTWEGVCTHMCERVPGHVHALIRLLQSAGTRDTSLHWVMGFTGKICGEIRTHRQSLHRCTRRPLGKENPIQDMAFVAHTSRSQLTVSVVSPLRGSSTIPSPLPLTRSVTPIRGLSSQAAPESQADLCPVGSKRGRSPFKR